MDVCDVGFTVAQPESTPTTSQVLPSRAGKGGKGQECFINDQRQPFCDTNLVAVKSGSKGCACEEYSLPILFGHISTYPNPQNKEISIPLDVSQINRLFTFSEQNNGLSFLYYDPHLSYVDPGNYYISNLINAQLDKKHSLYINLEEIHNTEYFFLYFQPYVDTHQVFCKDQTGFCEDDNSLFYSRQISDQSLKKLLDSAQLVNGRDYFIISHNFDGITYMAKKGQSCNYLNGGCDPQSSTICSFEHSNPTCQSKTNYLSSYTFEYFIDSKIENETDKIAIKLAQGTGNGVTTVQSFTVTYPAPSWGDTSQIYFYLKDPKETKYTSNLNSQYAFFYTCDGNQYKLMEDTRFWSNHMYTRPNNDTHLYGPMFECDFKISGSYTVGILGYITNTYSMYHYDRVVSEFGYATAYTPTQISNKLKTLDLIDQYNPNPVIDNRVEISKLSIAYKSSELYKQCNLTGQPYCTQDGYQCISGSVCSNAITIKAKQLTTQKDESEFTFFTTDKTTQARKKSGLSILPDKKVNNEIEFVRNKTIGKLKPLALGVRSNIQPPKGQKMTYAIQYDCGDGDGFLTDLFGGLPCFLGDYCQDISKSSRFVFRKTTPFSDGSFRDGPLHCFYDGMKDGIYPLKIKYYAAEGELTYDQIKLRTPYEFTIDVRVVTH